MTTTPDQAPQEAAFFRTIREWGITRGDNGVIGGVAEGLGDRVGMARVPARLILVVAAIPLTALVLIGYAAAWGLLPDRKGNIIVQNFGRGVPNVGALIGIAVLALMGFGSFDHGSGLVFNTGSWSSDFPWDNASLGGVGRVIVIVIAILVPLLVTAAIITGIVLLVKKNGNGAAAAQGAVYAAPPVPPSQNPSSAASPSPGAAAPSPGPAPTPPAPTAAAAVPPAQHWAPAPPAPPLKPRVPGPGRAFYLLALSWAAIATAASAWLERTDRLAVHPFIAGIVIFVTGLGVILVLVSLAGRKLGFLGFVGIVSLIPLLVFAGNADSLRSTYAQTGGITAHGSDAMDVVNGIVIDIGPSAVPTDAFDPTLAFGDTYSNVYFNGSCYQGQPEQYGTSSVQRLNLASEVAPSTDGAVVPDTSIDVTAEVTYLSLPSGTNVTLTGEDFADATVVFPDHNMTCNFYAESGTYMELTHGDAPTVKLAVHDDQYANTIVIKEATS